MLSRTNRDRPSRTGRRSTAAIPSATDHGLNSLIGLPPSVGDAALAVVSLYVVIEAARLHVPRRLLGRMLFNIAIEFGLGVVPVLDDVFDVIWKANLRNVALLERHFGRSGVLRARNRFRAFGPAEGWQALCVRLYQAAIERLCARMVLRIE